MWSLDPSSSLAPSLPSTAGHDATVARKRPQTLRRRVGARQLGPAGSWDPQQSPGDPTPADSGGGDALRMHVRPFLRDGGDVGNLLCLRVEDVVIGLGEATRAPAERIRSARPVTRTRLLMLVVRLSQRGADIEGINARTAPMKTEFACWEHIQPEAAQQQSSSQQNAKSELNVGFNTLDGTSNR